jgi:hypothetical protein
VSERPTALCELCTALCTSRAVNPSSPAPVRLSGKERSSAQPGKEAPVKEGKQHSLVALAHVQAELPQHRAVEAGVQLSQGAVAVPVPVAQREHLREAEVVLA